MHFMDNQKIPSGWGLWYHGTSLLFNAFDDEERMANLGGDGNSGLGHFLAASLSGATQYVEHDRERGNRADVLIVAALEDRSYCASSVDFWCQDEVCPEEEEDPIGFMPPGGLITREKLMTQGYNSLVIDDIDGTGAVMAMFEGHNLQVLKRLTAMQAERLEYWLHEHHQDVTEPNAQYALIEQWCAEDALTGYRTFGDLLQRQGQPSRRRSPVLLP